MQLLCINKPSKNYALLIKEYEKRISKYTQFTVIELKNDKDIAKHLKGKIIVLDETGKQHTSKEFASLLHEKNTTFIIGGAEGLPEHIKNKANILLSLGKITLPHQLARLVLTEQIYRGFSILKGEQYHKE